MLIKPAYAQAAGGEPSFLVSLLPLILIFVVFWFLLIRPQQKRMRDHRAMIAALKKGDKVLTAGGIYGTVARVLDDSTLEVEIATGVKVRVSRATISENLSGTAVALPKPANADKPAKSGRKDKDKETKAAEAEPANDAAEPTAGAETRAEVDEGRPDPGKGSVG